MYSSQPLSEKGKTTLPLILHVDMDAFFASVEIRSDPRLQKLPVVVGGGPGPRGVVTAASYPARVYGIRSGMAMAHARELCGHLISLPVNASKVVHESLSILRILEGYSQHVDPASIDEAYLSFDPVPGSMWPAKARSLAKQIQDQVWKERRLTCSIGAGQNRLQAKMASARKKPHGITLVIPGSFASLFHGEPVGVVPGIGDKTQARLHRLGIQTLGDLCRSHSNILAPVFGDRYARVLRELARGIDKGVVQYQEREGGPKSASHEMTFPRDVQDTAYLEASICLLADRVARRLRRGGLYASTVGIRYTVGKRKHSRQTSLNHATQRANEIASVAWPLVPRGLPLRLVGVVGMGLTSTGPPPELFPQESKKTILIQVSDSLRDKFGDHVLMPGRTYWARGPSHRTSTLRGWHPPEAH